SSSGDAHRPHRTRPRRPERGGLPARLRVNLVGIERQGMSSFAPFQDDILQPFREPLWSIHADKERGMARVELTDDTLIVHVDGVDKFLAFKSRIECPLEHVVGAELGVDPDVQEHFNRSVRLPGSYMPPFVIAGTYVYRHEGEWARQFWDVHRREKV